MKVREVLKILSNDDRVLVATRGSHRQFKHQTKKGKVTVSGNLHLDIPKGTLKSILKQAGFK